MGFAGGSSATLTDNLPFGTLVNGSATFATSATSETTGSTAFLLNSTSNYVGISFLNETTGLTNYGWVQLSLSAAFNSQPRTVIAFAFDNTGAGITVSAIPEPGTYATLGLMALGAFGVRVWKRAARVA